ncbi:MAG: precorrin-4 C(11)-methyltransferase [Syntrophobacteraceae bacterium]|jgi:precorrin-4/cobalt-precorrin-4 C11-methyltransferase|nr:precorrin-4 C(11)-methyltransferase [Syntrophobacteraceae bacterium]
MSVHRFPVSFVGAGPGDPELITVKGSRLLREADRIVYAGSLVPVALLEGRKPGAEVHDSAGLALEETHRLLRDGYAAGMRVVRLHTGDPSLYGAIQEQMDLLDRDAIPCEVVPGVSAVFATAAALRQELTLPDISQTLILTRMAGRTPVPEAESLESLASHGATLAVYLSVQRMEEVVSRLSAGYPPHTPVVVAYRVGWPDQVIVRGTLESIAGQVRASGIRRQAIIMIGDVLGARDRDRKTRSRLYDETFSHGFRNGSADT